MKIVENECGKFWYVNDLLHREDGPAFEDTCGYKAWYMYGQLHRVDGPAVEDTCGYNAWYMYGQLHRVDGPAVKYATGAKQWWVNGEKYSYEEWLKIIPNNILYMWRLYCGNC